MNEPANTTADTSVSGSPAAGKGQGTVRRVWLVALLFVLLLSAALLQAILQYQEGGGVELAPSILSRYSAFVTILSVAILYVPGTRFLERAFDLSLAATLRDGFDERQDNRGFLSVFAGFASCAVAFLILFIFIGVERGWDLFGNASARVAIAFVSTIAILAIGLRVRHVRTKVGSESRISSGDYLALIAFTASALAAVFSLIAEHSI
ncbi:MAG: hypothetical protein AAGK23_00950 [Pseudomonadota bacterium]